MKIIQCPRQAFLANNLKLQGYVAYVLGHMIFMQDIYFYVASVIFYVFFHILIYISLLFSF